MSHKTLEAQAIPIPPHLTGKLKQALGRSGTGFDEGAFLQQLHFWTLNSGTTGWVIDGVKWIYNSLKSWLEQFPWMSEYGLRKAITNLKKLRLIQTAQHWISSYKRIMFYRIDYEQLATFSKDVCDLITDRRANSDQVDVSSERMTYIDILSNKSLSEQQTVVSAIDESFKDTHSLEVSDFDQAGGIEASGSELDKFSPPSSGNKSGGQHSAFPELIDAVAQAIAHPPCSPLPTALKTAITQFPERVQQAITYLQHQRKRRTVQNPIGYLYSAIVEGWNLSLNQPSGTVTPVGFSEWFDQARAQGLIIAATTIDGVHHTLHAEQGWIPTVQIMQLYPLTPV